MTVLAFFTFTNFLIKKNIDLSFLANEWLPGTSVIYLFGVGILHLALLKKSARYTM